MATIDYRLTLYEADGVTVLTPRAGAAHTDAFRIATVQGVSGYQPYMGVPRGRSGRIDPLSRQQDVGELTIDVYDVALTAGDNFTRWWTAYMGNALGENQQLALIGVVEERIDGGAWTTFYTGEVETTGLATRTRGQLVLRDATRAMDHDVFVGRPHASVTYANLAPALPVGGPTQPYREFATVPLIPATVRAWSRTGFGSGHYFEIDTTAVGIRDTDHPFNVVTTALTGSENIAVLRYPQGAEYIERLRVRATITSGARAGETGILRLAVGVNVPGFGAPTGPFSTTLDVNRRWRVELVFVEQLPASHVDFFAMPGVGETISFEIQHDDEPTDVNPLLVDDVHPVLYLRHLALGYFGAIDEAGAPLNAMAIDTASFTALEADTSFPPLSKLIDGRRKFGDEWHATLQSYNLGYRTDEQNRIVLLDFRRPTSLAGVATISNADLGTSDVPAWEQGRKTAISVLKLQLWQDEKVDLAQAFAGEEGTEYTVPALPPVGIRTSMIPVVPFPFGRPGLAKRTHTIDTDGYRFGGARGAIISTFGDHNRAAYMLGQLNALARDLESEYGSGVATMRLLCLRTANTTGCQPGDLRILDVDELPDPASNLRGGQRVVRCLERTHAGVLLDLLFQDLGPSTVCVTPVLGALASTSGKGIHAIDVPVTRNASSDPVRVDVAVTTTAVAVRPAEDAQAWTFGAWVTANGTVTVEDLPAGKRVWVRARSQSTPNVGPKLPSAWVFPSGAGFIDTTALPTPSITPTVLNGSEVELQLSASVSDLRWEILLDGERVEIIDAGADYYIVRGLEASTLYAFGARLLDHRGNPGPTTTANATTGATPATLPDVVGLTILIGEPQ